MRRILPDISRYALSICRFAYCVSFFAVTKFSLCFFTSLLFPQSGPDFAFKQGEKFEVLRQAWRMPTWILAMVVFGGEGAVVLFFWVWVGKGGRNV